VILGNRVFERSSHIQNTTQRLFEKVTDASNDAMTRTIAVIPNSPTRNRKGICHDTKHGQLRLLGDVNLKESLSDLI
jgi:hypothetical protein